MFLNSCKFQIPVRSCGFRQTLFQTVTAKNPQK